MWSFLRRRLANEKGAMDKILVTLLLVVVGAAAVVGLSSWMGTQSNTVKNSAANAISNAMN